MFFYAIFGAVLLSRDKTKSLTVLTIIALACFLTFRFYILDETQTLSSQWATYISPFNHLITFLMGGLAYFMMKKSRKFIEGGRYFFLIGSMFLFIHQVEGDRITLILGKEGLALLRYKKPKHQPSQELFQFL
jgi:peptidoglycan/LPS O-acetylase OafA/YrhL